MFSIGETYMIGQTSVLCIHIDEAEKKALFLTTEPIESRKMQHYDGYGGGYTKSWLKRWLYDWTLEYISGRPFLHGEKELHPVYEVGIPTIDMLNLDSWYPDRPYLREVNISPRIPISKPEYKDGTIERRFLTEEPIWVQDTNCEWQGAWCTINNSASAVTAVCPSDTINVRPYLIIGTEGINPLFSSWSIRYN